MTRQHSLKKLISLTKRCSKRGRGHLVKRSPEWFIQSLQRASKAYTNDQLPKGKRAATAKRRLAHYRKDSNYLANCNSTKKARKRLLQSGGFLPALLPILGLIGKAALGGAAAAGAGMIVKKIARK